MNLYTSYFYQVRFFPKNLIPLSTAVWPPKYFGTPYTQHLDSRGVLVGLDIPPFKPGKSCEGLCSGSCLINRPNSCAFIKAYSKQLEALDFNKIMEGLNKLANQIKEGQKLDTVDFAFMLYEAPTNLCSERKSIQNFFNNHNVECKEWHTPSE